MIQFTGGPIDGKTLALKRAPYYLRVVQSGGGFDALDQLDDRASADETITAYRLVENRGQVHICRSPRRLSGWFAMAWYVVVESQPDDATMRSNELWQAWCQANRAAFDEFRERAKK